MWLNLCVTLIALGTLVECGWGKKGGKAGQRKKHNWGDMTEKQIDGFRKSLRGTNVDRFVAALDRMNEARGKEIEPSDKQKAVMTENMKHIKKHVRSPKIHALGEDLDEVNQKAGVSGGLYGGDMALSDSQVDAILGDFVDDSDVESDARKKRQAYYTSQYPSNLWGSTFYYYFDPSLSAEAKAIAQVAIAFWQNSTCINFVESSTAANRVRFFKGSGCYSYVGMIGGAQDLSLGEGCQWFRQAAHEIGHALGFFHMQNRYDRDTAITVNTANMQPDYVYAYDKETTGTNNNYNMPYDYGSVMQYSDTSFSSNGGKTMISTNPVYQDTMGSQSVSFYDISMMNEYYQCKQKCPTGATCVNGGFRNTRNCNTCICPSGYGGTTCADRQTGCGAVLTATATAQTQTFTLGAPTMGEQKLFETCNYLIKAPVGYKIEIVLTALTNLQCNAGCSYSGLEVKALKDHRYTGIRYCCADDVNTKVITEGNVAPVIGYNRYSQPQYTFTYRYVAATTASTIQMSQIPFTKSSLDGATDPGTYTTPKPPPSTTPAGCTVSVNGQPQQIVSGCQFCNGVAGSTTQIATCTNGGFQLANCPNSAICYANGNCAVTCAAPTTAKPVTTVAASCTVSVNGQPKQIASGCQFCNGLAGNTTATATCSNGGFQLANCLSGKICYGNGECAISCR